MKGRISPLGALYCVSLAIAAASSVTAAAAAEESSSATKEAAARLKAGLEHAHYGRWDQARLSFLQGYSVAPKLNLLWNLALAELKSGHAIEALQHFEQYKEDPKADRADIAALPSLREQAYTQIGRVKVQAPAEASVWVDGMIVPNGPSPINLVPGEHTVKVGVGRNIEEQRLTLSPGQIATIVSSISISAGAAGQQLEASTPNAARPPASGSNGDTAAVPESYRRPTKLTLGWIGVGITTGAVATGIGFLLAANAKETEGSAAAAGARSFGCNVAPQQGFCADARNAASQHDTFQEISTAGFLAAGALGALTAGYFLFVPRSEVVSAAPYAGAHRTGVTVRVQF